MNWSLAIVIWLICLGVGAAITSSKNRGPGEGAALGGLLGIIGVIIAACLSKQLPSAPAGMISVKCSRCNAIQNIAAGVPSFQCWQCHLQCAAPGFEDSVHTDARRAIKCHNCNTVYQVPPDATTLTCAKCQSRSRITPAR